MEEVLATLRLIQKELEEQKTFINKKGEEVTENVTININNILEEKFAVIEEKHENLKKRVENQEQRIYFLEKQARQRNLVFFGLHEDENSYSSMETKIIKFVHEYFTIKLDYIDLVAIRRIGKKSDKPRPIVVTFATLGRKISILKNKGTLKGTPYYVKEDYPQSVLQIRKELQEQVKAERENGNTAIIKYDKLVILKNTNNKQTTTPTNTNNKKRNLSNSPVNAVKSYAEQRPHANKKNKISSYSDKAKIFKLFRKRFKTGNFKLPN
ncbi:jg21272 [Pararge aegeria aegeria]|uniref:Jg21272 protein n=1 Tax=Pararge aegeria aegeria TaxID=348720 RepID=A0A8S4QDM2_9NEOP|nr:jg21272 [Pararge aegeria aegeria]